MAPLHHKKIFIIGIVFLAAVSFFGFYLNRYLSPSKASEEKAIVFFEKPTIVTNADVDSIPVNIFLQMSNGNKVSGAQVQVAYSTNTLVYDTSRQGQFDVSCTGATNGLNNLVDVVHNEQTGTIRIRRVRVDNIDANLPPLTDSGLFCFTTIYFKPKPGVLYPQNGTVTLSSDSAVYEIVGPGKIYAPDFFTSTNSTTINIGKSLITPTPVCKIGVKNFSLMQQCDTTSFHYISFTCQDGSTNQIGADETCEAQELLKQKSQAACAGKSSCSVTVTPSPTCSPRPACLDATPRCMVAEPIGGYCNDIPLPSIIVVSGSPTPSSTPSAGLSPTPDSCPLKSKGDCSCNGKVDIFDFEAWRKEFTKEASTIKCDNNSDGKITLADFNRWLAGFFADMKKI